jgi:hypothetical protein
MRQAQQPPALGPVGPAQTVIQPHVSLGTVTKETWVTVESPSKKCKTVGLMIRTALLPAADTFAVSSFSAEPGSNEPSPASVSRAV